MALNDSKGNMYDFITHTWNAIKGKCYHDCSYCYMKRFGNLKPVRLDEKELRTDLGNDNFIFVGSSCDIFATDIPDEWILKTLKHCERHDNRYLFQTKNPERFMNYIDSSVISDKSILCTTIESNRWFPEIMGNSPYPEDRAKWMSEIDCVDKYVTIEPVLDFDLDEMVKLIKRCNPIQVNIGADSGGNKLPEPSQEKVQSLIASLSGFTNISRKKNLNRLVLNNLKR